MITTATARPATTHDLAGLTHLQLAERRAEAHLNALSAPAAPSQTRTAHFTTLCRIVREQNRRGCIRLTW